MAKTFQTNKKAIRLSLAILAGLILGALFGLVMPDWAEPVTSFMWADRRYCILSVLRCLPAFWVFFCLRR